MHDIIEWVQWGSNGAQGIQLMHDTASFGGFTNGFLTAFRDEFFKLPCLAFPLLSSSIPGSVDQDNVSVKHSWQLR